MKYEKFVLKNGLRVIFHQDKKTPIAAINLIYDVGSKDESPTKTGYAHLLEHLMFEGSVNIPDFDLPLQKVGGTNNAFTNSDYTNYYITLPKENIETALWLESDRMISLAFDPERFETQKNVVIEEFKQTALNEPYGDDMMILSNLAYKKHNYRWITLGKDISHIENAKIDDLKKFYYEHYAPNNAILSIAGNFDLDYIKEITEKWFGEIPSRKIKKRKNIIEPPQTKLRRKTVVNDVPFDVLYMTFHYGGRISDDYYIFDVITDIFDDGNSSRFFQRLIKEKNIFDELEAYITGTIEPGLIIISGRPAKGISLEKAEEFLWKELDDLKNNFVSSREIQKSINSLEFSLAIQETKVTSKSSALAFYELAGDIELVNQEKNRYQKITKEIIKEASAKVFVPENCNILYYLSNNKKHKK